MRKYLTLLAFVPALALADTAYRLDIGAEVHGNNLKVEPTVVGPAEKALRYEMKVRREGQGGSSNSSQSGTVKLDADGRGQLASNSVNVSPSDRYEITVRLFDGGRVVAEQSAQYP
jgi:thin aggregative fimbriae synthesis protein